MGSWERPCGGALRCEGGRTNVPPQPEVGPLLHSPFAPSPPSALPPPPPPPYEWPWPPASPSRPQSCLTPPCRSPSSPLSPPSSPLPPPPSAFSSAFPSASSSGLQSALPRPPPHHPPPPPRCPCFPLPLPPPELFMNQLVRTPNKPLLAESEVTTPHPRRYPQLNTNFY